MGELVLTVNNMVTIGRCDFVLMAAGLFLRDFNLIFVRVRL